MASLLSILLVIVTIFSVVRAQVTSGYVTRTDYVDQACTQQIRNVTLLANACSPVASNTAAYFPNNQSVVVTFYTDKTCTTATATAVYNAFECIPSTPTPYSYTYSTTVPSLVTQANTYTVHDPAVAGCSGNVFYVEQDYNNVCFLNTAGSFHSQIFYCHGSTLNSTVCTDNSCSTGCVTSISTVGSTCDTGNHATTSCSPPNIPAASGTTSSTTASTTAAVTASVTTGSTTGSITTGSSTASTTATATSGSTTTNTTGTATTTAGTATAGSGKTATTTTNGSGSGTTTATSTSSASSVLASFVLLLSACIFSM